MNPYFFCIHSMTGEPEIQESNAPNSHFGRKCQVSTEGECYDASVRKIMLVKGDQNVYPSFVYTVQHIDPGCAAHSKSANNSSIAGNPCYRRFTSPTCVCDLSRPERKDRIR